jgi:thiol-disulfide isomerase/thioredoxin
MKHAMLIVELLVCLVMHAQPEQASDAPEARPVVVQFTASWCPHCQKIAPAFAKLQSEGFDVIQLDVDKNPGKAQSYGVSTIPAVLVIEPAFEGGDKITGRLSGKMNEASIRKLFRDKGVKAKTPNQKGR